MSVMRGDGPGRRRPSVMALALVALSLVATPTSAKTLLKLGTLAPEGSAWHLILKDLAEQWRNASDGEVELRIYPGGVAGDEPDMVRKMRIGQLHAAAFTIVGLSLLSPEPQALSIPMMYDTYEQLDYVREKVEPTLEQRLEAKGYIVLNWGDAGWIRFFSTKPVSTPSDVQKLKLFVWTGDQATVDVWKDAGFTPIPLAATDILSSLQTGIIDVAPSTALAALGTQTFTVANYMLDVHWAPLVGGTVVAADRWNRIPAELRPKLLAISRDIGQRMRAEIRRLDAESIEAMAKRGLKVQTVDAAVTEEWRALAEKAYPRVRDSIVPAEMFDRVRSLRDEHRRQGAGEAPASSR